MGMVWSKLGSEGKYDDYVHSCTSDFSTSKSTFNKDRNLVNMLTVLNLCTSRKTIGCTSLWQTCQPNSQTPLDFPYSWCLKPTSVIWEILFCGRRIIFRILKRYLSSRSKAIDGWLRDLKGGVCHCWVVLSSLMVYALKK